MDDPPTASGCRDRDCRPMLKGKLVHGRVYAELLELSREFVSNREDIGSRGRCEGGIVVARELTRGRLVLFFAELPRT